MTKHRHHSPVAGQSGPFMARLAFALSGALTVFAAHAQTAVQAVTAAVQGGTEVIRIQTNGPLKQTPNIFAMQTPARIALDFAGLTNAVGQNLIELNQGNLRSANVVEAGDRTRVVLNLNQFVRYEAKVDGNAVVIVLEPVPTVASGAKSSGLGATFAESQRDEVAPLSDIDFRRGSDETGRIVVRLSNAQTGIDIRPQGKSLVVEFMKTSLPAALRRRLDVADFGTPVKTITTTQNGDRVRMVIEPTGHWEHSAYQSDNQFVIEVREQKVDPTKLTQGAGYSGEKITLMFHDESIRTVLKALAEFTDFNIIATEEVKGNVTIKLRDVPWDQALDVILEAHKLNKKVNGNVIYVSTKKDFDEVAEAELKAKGIDAKKEDLKTVAFRLNYAKALEIAAQLTGGTITEKQKEASDDGKTFTVEKGEAKKTSILSERGSVLADPRTNQLFVTDIASVLEKVSALVAKVDVARRQVMIEARIVEATDGFSKSLGVRLGGVDLRGIRGGDAGYTVGGGKRVALGGSYDAIGATTGQLPSTALTAENSSFVNLPAVSPDGLNVPKFALTLFSPSANRFLNLELSALESENKGKVISSPRIVAGDFSKATITQGEQVKLVVPGYNNGAPRVETIDANLKLDVEPQITPNGSVLLKLVVTKNSLAEFNTSGARLAVKEIKTEVMVDNGGTVVIGGIFEQEELKGVDQVPLLGDIPVLGHLFKTRNIQTKKTETLIFITPQILDRNIN